MKKLLLFVLAFGIGFAASAQYQHELKSTKAPMDKVLVEPVPQGSSSILNDELPETIQGRAATYVSIGKSGNAYGFYSNPRTYLWAEPNLNSVTFVHRMVGGVEVEGNSRLAYDVSTDGGATWATNANVYTPTGPGPQYPQAAARYPQGGIVNPEGNTDPANAYFTYFCPTLDNTNSTWGGYGYGSNMLTETDPTNPTQVNLTTEDGYYRLIPDAFTITSKGVAWYIEPSSDGATGTYEYTGEVIVGKGEMVDGEMVYEESLFEFMSPLEAFNDTKIAFGPDGMTGYMLFMTDAAISGEIPYTSYHPVLVKTTDGGDTWEDPVHVQFGGVDGIESIKYYWSDEILESIDAYGPGFDRDEVYYNMGFQVDLIVDGQGNPHITGIIAIGTEDGWYPGYETMATWHVYSKDGGVTFDATALYDNIFLEGDIGGLTQYNRPYAASTYDGHYLFFSWIDTDLDGAEANTNPNIFVVGYDSEDHFYTEVNNVTELSLYWFSAFYGSMSQYVFATEVDDVWECEIPFVFTEYTVPGDPAAEMNFYYVDDYTLAMPVGIDNTDNIANFAVAQNSPNPAVNQTSVLVTTEAAGQINFRISNILGQVVHNEIVNNGALAHTFTFDVSNYEAGIYFYTVQIGEKSITKKMLVK